MSSVRPANDGDEAGLEAEEGSSYYYADESKGTQIRSPLRSVTGNHEPRVVAPSIEHLDPAVTAAILTQAAFRGYRLRYRLRRLPAREAERAIRALHVNAHGFRRIAVFLVFFGLFFSLVFSSADVDFQRTVHQGLESHLGTAKYGPEKDRTHTDVTSLSEIYQWMQAFYLQTYSGTQLEDRCTACVVKPPDDVCNACMFDINDANVPNATLGVTNSGSISNQQTGSDSSSNSGSDSSNDSNGSSSGDIIMGLSEECEACVVGRFCTESYLENCAASLDTDSSTSSPDEEDGDAPGGVSSASSSVPSASNTSVELAINTTALNALVLEPVGGVTAAKGHLVIEDMSQCNNFNAIVGLTENVARFKSNLTLLLNGGGFVADRNRIIGGMLVTFSRRVRLSEEKCEASRGYTDVCLGDKEYKETVTPGGAWADLRPDKEVIYNEVAGGYPILVGTGGYNTGLNRGMCVLFAMEDLDIIPPDEVKTVSVQLATYNGNQKTAFGSIFVKFNFDDGGTVSVAETISAYVLTKTTEGSLYRTRWVLVALFWSLFLGMVWHDTSKWWHLRRSKAKRKGRCVHRVCGFTFFALVFVNMVLWVIWTSGFSGKSATGKEDVTIEMPSIDSLSKDVVTLHQVALFVSAYYFVFLLTTMAGLFRWIFQVGESFGTKCRDGNRSARTQMLTFHKRMSVVADTLCGACTHLQHILLVAFLVVAVFANLTWFLVGSRLRDFSTAGKAWRSVIRVLLGEYETFYQQIMEAQPTVGPLIVVAYQVLGVVLLLNVVIAVLLEAYRVVVEGTQDEDTIVQSLAAFVGMTLCMTKARIQWANAYVRWRLSDATSRHERRPSLKLALQGPNSVCGVDGQPVLLIKKSSGSSLTPADRQLSFNCPRYISVADMQVLIKAAPVPAFVADRLVRKIVNKWIFQSTEKPTNDTSATSRSGYHGRRGRSVDRSTDSVPTLRRRDSPLRSTHR